VPTELLMGCAALVRRASPAWRSDAVRASRLHATAGGPITRHNPQDFTQAGGGIDTAQAGLRLCALSDL